jgi:hypothetical protein
MKKIIIYLGLIVIGIAATIGSLVAYVTFIGSGIKTG